MNSISVLNSELHESEFWRNRNVKLNLISVSCTPPLPTPKKIQ